MDVVDVVNAVGVAVGEVVSRLDVEPDVFEAHRAVPDEIPAGGYVRHYVRFVGEADESGEVEHGVSVQSIEVRLECVSMAVNAERALALVDVLDGGFSPVGLDLDGGRVESEVPVEGEGLAVYVLLYQGSYLRGG